VIGRNDLGVARSKYLLTRGLYPCGRRVSRWPTSGRLRRKRCRQAVSGRPAEAALPTLKSRLLLLAAGIDPVAHVLGVVGLHLQSSSVMASSTLSPVTS